jgi:hypothetical protein
MMPMQKDPQGQLDINFPKKYLQKFAKHRKRSSQLTPKPKRPRKPSDFPEVFSSHCKQAISIAGTKIYCCVLKESVSNAMCKSCPGHEPEPLEYTLFKRE